MAKNSQEVKKKVVLIVEDDEVLLRALYVFFHSDEYTIATATDGDTAVKMTQRLKPDIILLDLLLPKMDGFKFLEIVKTIPVIKDIPVIVLSNLGDTVNMERAKSLGALDYFIKSSVDLEKLAEKIKSII